METLSMFDLAQEEKVRETGSGGSKNLDVVRMEYAGVETLSWQELFDGFDSLHAITYSSGVNFICKLLDKFQTAEIIFGNEEIISGTLQEIMAYQTKMVERLKDTASKTKKDLLDRVEDGSLRLFVARQVLSHEKIYEI